MSDILAVGLLVTVLAGGLTLLRLPSENGGFHWFVAWVSLGLAGGLRLMTPEVPLLEHLLPPLGTQFGALILAGAFLFAGRPLPRWLLPAAAVLMGARALAHAAGQVELAIALGEVAETPAVLAAAWLVWQAGARTGPLVPTRMLGTLLVAVAVADTVQHVGAIAVGPHWSGGLLLWLLVAPPALGAHYLALTRRTADALSRSHEELEQRFALRTTELRDTVARLEREVVERVAAEEALRRSEERFRQISELASDLAFCVRISPGGELSLDWLWGAFERITGYPPDALDGHGWLSLLDADTQRGMAGELARAPQAGARSTERKIVRRDGEERWLQLRFQSVRTDSDGTLEVMGSGSDVTDRVHAETEQRRLEAHMQRAQRAESLGILAGGVAHDFNNLLTVIRGNVRLALEDEAPDSPARERLERVRTAAEHAASLTEQMLAYAGKSTAELEPVDLGGLAERMMGLLLASVSDRCTLETELRAELPLVEADAGQLRQVILNLVINASESLGDEPGRVTVRTGVRRLDAAELAGCVGATGAEPGEYVLLEVADTGCGMDPDTQGRVFEPFFTTKFSGRGLGMAALLGIV
ncbi:MAG: PAS domain S-box protein, partial [Myxococcota bacterium]|nr:PAS domain S-box protein [Myxococcota bacterium]